MAEKPDQTPPSTEVDGTIGEAEAEWWAGPKARIFISCGQRDEEERGIAEGIRSLVKDLGYCPYLAFAVHSSKALTDGIHGHLRTAEYFLFVDFRRERLGTCGPYRGSLFSNQELAIASFLELDCLFFVEKGVEKRQGVLGAIQGNPITFESRSGLMAQIKRGLIEAGWDSGHRRELRIERDPAQSELAGIPGGPSGGSEQVRYYQANLRNLHHRQLATGCIVQVLGIRDLTRGTTKFPDVVEMKFKHVVQPSVSIPPSSVRQFDGVVVPLRLPSRAVLGILNVGNVDSELAIRQHTIDGPGDFEIDVAAFSREFAPCKATLSLHLGSSIDDVRLLVKGVSPAAPAVVRDMSKVAGRPLYPGV